MLKTLKWAYSLGVRQERVRISAHLQNVSREAELGIFSDENLIRSDKQTSKRRKEKLVLDVAVNQRIIEIIRHINQPEPSYLGFSLMFPDDKHGKGIK